MSNILATLIKMLRNEADLGYRDMCVQGGFQNFSDTWAAGAKQDGVPEELDREVRNWLAAYHGMDLETRKTSLQILLQTVQGASAAAPNPTAAEAPASATPPAASMPPAAAPAAPPAPPESQPSQPERNPLTLRELVAPLTSLQGVGEKNSEALERLGLRTIGDLLWFLPRRYVDYSTVKPINRLWYGETVTLLAAVQESHTRRTKRGSLTELTVSDGSGTLLVTFFNQPWIETRLHKGQLLALSGKVGQYLGRLTMSMPEWEFLDRQQIRTGGIVPAYRLTAGVNQNFLRRLIHSAITRLADRLPDPLPAGILAEGKWLPLGMALHNIHFPASWELQQKAKDRLGFEELLYLQLGILQQKRNWVSANAHAFPALPAVREWIGTLPFPLTAAQERTISEIQADLESGRPMNRLLQGDVGSGKTVVAFTAALTVALQGGQAALLAPTGILAEQHFQLLQSIAAGEGKPLRAGQIALLLGSTPESEKQTIRAGLASGEIAVVVGTHALLEAPIAFKQLDLAVIDEQHRFGVEQRAALRAKGGTPHLLVMTATPIPRSLALTIYGDLDLSALDEMPPGRQPVTTRILLPGERERAYAFINGQLKGGHQAFIICPRIEEAENGEVTAAVEEHKRLQEKIFPEWKLGLLHGRLRPEEKDEVMGRFRAGELHILVSTSVVEVGVDVPNATVMMVEGASMFGLSQLHQFRGRVGRSTFPSYCILATDSDDETENARLRAMEETQDGFALAEKDLQQRGPGDFFGTRQSGFAEIDLGHLLNVQLIEAARAAALKVFAEDPDLKKPENRLMAERVAVLWNTGQGDLS
jgi:ATP-dependent DNA helicase RecG